jgi:uncharacterized repeat protein (TIGR02543 family)
MKKTFLRQGAIALIPLMALALTGVLLTQQSSSEVAADTTPVETKTYIHQIWIQPTDLPTGGTVYPNARFHFWLETTDWTTPDVVQKNLSDLNSNLAANFLVDSTANVVSQTLCFGGNAQGSNTANYVAYGTNKTAAEWQAVTLTVNAGAQFPSYAYAKGTTSTPTFYEPGATQKFKYSSTDGNGCYVFTQIYDETTNLDTQVRQIMVQPTVNRCHFLLSEHDYTGVAGWANVNNASGFNANSKITFNGTNNLLSADTHYNTNDTGSIGYAGTSTIISTEETSYKALKVLIPAGTEFPSYVSNFYSASAKTQYVTAKDRLYAFNTANTTDKLYYYDPVKYSISFVNDDGTILQQKDTLYGDTPVYEGATPTKNSSVQYDYAFSGWDKTIDVVTEQATYTATYTSTIRSYTITFKNGDTVVSTQSVAFGSLPTIPDAIDKAADEQYTYSWKGWADTNGDIYTGNDFEVAGDATYFATWTSIAKKYEIKFIAEGKTLSDEQIDYGTIATVPSDPTKESSVDKVYTFSGWYDDLTAGNKVTDFTVKGAMTYYAHFAETTRKYAITFKNGDVVISTSNVDYGSLPTVPSALTKEATAQYTYVWAGWADKEGKIITDFKVSGDATYFATWTSSVNSYTVSFEEADVAAEKVDYGSTATKPEDPSKKDYSFEGWYLGDTLYDFTTPITGNITLTAKWKKKANVGLIVGLSVGGVVLVGGGLGLFFFLKHKKKA